MTTDAEETTEWANATAELKIAGKTMRLEMPVPAGPTRLVKLLPFFRYLTDAFVDLSVEDAREEGLTVSCKKGCGACCRQLVPISEIETRRLAEVVNEMPEPRKSTILARFENARIRLQEAGLLEKLRRPNSVGDEEVDPLGLEYFRLAIACPFLENESCSIYAERPLACREYLVVTPAENCAQPTVDSIESVKLVARVAKTIRSLDAERSREGARWVPLILALEWAETHPDETLQSLGTDLVREVFGRLLGRKVPATKEDGDPGS